MEHGTTLTRVTTRRVFFPKRRREMKKKTKTNEGGGRKQTDKDRDYSKKCDLWSEVIE